MMAVSNNILLILLLMSVFSGVTIAEDHLISTYYVSNYCGNTLDMAAKNVDEFMLELTSTGYHDIFMDCDMTIVTSPHHILLFAFQSLSLLSCGDSVTVYGYNMSDAISPRLCHKPSDNYITSGPVGTVTFTSDWFGFQGGFKILVTSLYVSGNGNCGPNYFECDNHYCIKSGLECNTRNNCGDNSDNDKDCNYNLWWIILVSCLCAGVIITIIGVVICVCIHNNSKRKVQTMGGRVLATGHPQVTTYPNQTHPQGYSMTTHQQTGSTLPVTHFSHPNQTLPQGYLGTTPTTAEKTERSPSAPPPVSLPPELNTPAMGDSEDLYDNVPAPAVYINPTQTNTQISM